VNLIGMLWTRNEADIIEEVIVAAARQVDALFVADGHSTDGSWQLIRSLQRRFKNIEHVQQENESEDRAQRNSLLDKIRERYKPEDTWVQVFEGDMFTLETDIRTAIRDYAVEDMGVPWFALNACRLRGTWAGVDRYPDWPGMIRETMPYAHYMETLLYSFRPLPELRFVQKYWRPWPRGFSHYTSQNLFLQPCGREMPLLLHVGYRGPKHFYSKYGGPNKQQHQKYESWNLSTPESIEKTVYFFNGVWNAEAVPATRAAWIASKYGSCHGADTCTGYHGRSARAADHRGQPHGLAGAAEA
jgi:glycosyltransferase involved in cell wall biosynthesis